MSVFLNSSDAEDGIFWENKASAMAADALVPCSFFRQDINSYAFD